MSDNIVGKIPPQNLEAEQSIIGACIIDHKAVDVAVSMVNVSDFYRDGHGTIFKFIKHMHSEGKSVDLLTLTNELRDADVLTRIGGVSYLATMADIVPTTANVDYYCGIVVEKAELRRIIQKADAVMAEAFSGQSNPASLKQELTEFGLQRRDSGTDEGWMNISDVTDLTINYVRERMDNRGKLSGIPSGFHSLDMHTDGWERGMLNIVAARPSMGKTTFILNAAINAARHGFKVGIFPLEESPLQEGIRILSSSSGYHMYDLRRGFIDDDDWKSLSRYASEIKDLPIFFNKDSTVNLGRLINRVQGLKARHGLDLVIVDHAGEVDTSDVQGTDNKRIGAVATVCKRIARTLDVSAILTSQLSRNVEYREDKRPIMADLRESGELEQKADAIFFLYRPSYYYQDEQAWANYCAKQRRHPTPYPDSLVEIITAKGRNIGNDVTYLKFNKEINRMEEYSSDELNYYRKGTEPAKDNSKMTLREMAEMIESEDD